MSMEWLKCWGIVINNFFMNIRWYFFVDIILLYEKVELNVDVCVWLWRKYFINIWFDGERVVWKCFNIKKIVIYFLFFVFIFDFFGIFFL